MPFQILETVPEIPFITPEMVLEILLKMLDAVLTIPFQRPERNEPMPFHTSWAVVEMTVHALPKKSTNPCHIFCPVSVCVKNHTNAATSAVIAMMTIAIGLAERTALNIPKAPLAPIVAAVWVASAAVNTPDWTDRASINPFPTASKVLRTVSIAWIVPVTTLYPAHAVVMPTIADLNVSTAGPPFWNQSTKSLILPVASARKSETFLKLSATPSTDEDFPSIPKRLLTKSPIEPVTSLITLEMLSKAVLKLWMAPFCSNLAIKSCVHLLASWSHVVAFWSPVTTGDRSGPPTITRKSCHTCFKFPMTFSKPSDSRAACPIAPDTLLASSNMAIKVSCFWMPSSSLNFLPNIAVAFALRVCSVDRIPRLSATS